MPRTNPAVDEYFRNVKLWPAELAKLRTIILSTGLHEELKWRAPCYSHETSNIAIIGELKACCVLSFFNGAILKDPAGVLVKPGENTQAARVIRFTSVAEITKLKPVLIAYLHEAINLQQAGVKAIFKTEQEPIPQELQLIFDNNPAFETAFDALTPGRQRAYLLFFSAAKQSKTRTARIEQYMQQIFAGYGMNDCTCGLSKRMPGCDGSHKYKP